MDIYSFIKKKYKGSNAQHLVHNLKYLVSNDLSKVESDIIFRAKDEAIEDCVYEFDENKKFFRNLIILDEEASFEHLISHPKSLARYGDGEIKLIQGIDQAFQEYNPQLANKLLDLLEHKRDNLYVGLNRSYFHSAFNYSEENHRFYRIYGTRYRRYFLEVCDPSNIYLDACFYGGYFRLKDDADFNFIYDRNKSLFRGKKIAYVAGEGILRKLEHDVFEYAAEKRIISAPSKNAFTEYDNIIRKITKDIPKDFVICLSLGQTATVLAADLADLGYIAWDIGHLPKDYDTYKRGIVRNKENLTSFISVDL